MDGETLESKPGLIFSKLIEVTREIEAIGKTKSGDNIKYKFRGIDDLYNALHPLFSKQGIFITSTVLADKREERQTKNGGNLIYSILNIQFNFYAEDGSFVSSVIQGEGMDSGDKASNKAMSAGLKYALMQMFLIPTEDLEDVDKTQPPGSTKKPDQTKPSQTKKESGNFKVVEKILNSAGSITEIEKIKNSLILKTWTEKELEDINMLIIKNKARFKA